MDLLTLAWLSFLLDMLISEGFPWEVGVGEFFLWGYKHRVISNLILICIFFFCFLMTVLLRALVHQFSHWFQILFSDWQLIS